MNAMQVLRTVKEPVPMPSLSRPASSPAVAMQDMPSVIYLFVFVDINECDAGLDNCEGTCTDAAPPSKFTCSCPEGYTLNGDGFSCDGKYIGNQTWVVKLREGKDLRYNLKKLSPPNQQSHNKTKLCPTWGMDITW